MVRLLSTHFRVQKNTEQHMKTIPWRRHNAFTTASIHIAVSENRSDYGDVDGDDIDYDDVNVDCVLPNNVALGYEIESFSRTKRTVRSVRKPPIMMRSAQTRASS